MKQVSFIRPGKASPRTLSGARSKMMRMKSLSEGEAEAAAVVVL
jgi:hypothetical protein